MDGEATTTNELSDEQLATVAGGLRSRAYLPAVQGKQGEQAELEMLQLQSLLSQRTESLAMTTNMARATQDSTNSIIHNIGG